MQLAPRREHHDRRLALPPDLAADLEPVERREHDVEDDEVERALPEAHERVAPVAGRRHAEAGLLEAERRDLADGGVVLHEQHVLVHRRKAYARPRLRAGTGHSAQCDIVPLGFPILSSPTCPRSTWAKACETNG